MSAEPRYPYGHAEWLNWLRTKTKERCHAFDRVTITKQLDNDVSRPTASILGVCYSEFESGPNTYVLAQVATYLLGDFADGVYGFDSARRLGPDYRPMS